MISGETNLHLLAFLFSFYHRKFTITLLSQLCHFDLNQFLLAQKIPRTLDLTVYQSVIIALQLLNQLIVMEGGS
jgi:hypothetical protein